MAKKLTTVLIIEEKQKCLKLLKHVLSSSTDLLNFKLLNISINSDISTVLRKEAVDILLFDLSLQNDKKLFNKINKFSRDIPIFVLADSENESRAIEAIHSGAQDYLVKGTFDGKIFVHAVRSAIERQNVLKKLEQKSLEFQANEARLLNLIVNNVDGIIVVDKARKIRFINPAAEKLFSRSSTSELLKSTFKYPIIFPQSSEINIKGKDDNKFIEMRAVEMEWEGEKAYLISLRDITEHKKAEEGLKNTLATLKYALASEKVLLGELDRKNRDLVELSITDGLTGLYNHRFIQERFDFEFKRARRYKTELSCMLIDIDNFKLVNDKYGHQFGDLVLRELSLIIKQNTREVDICGRYGGEEFLIISTQNIEGAMKHAAKLHKAIENHIFSNDEHSIHITASLGIAEYANDILTKNEMLERSDVALYQAKEEGRNLVRVWKERGADEKVFLDLKGIKELKTKVVYFSNCMRDAYMESTNALLKAVDAKDRYTLVHSENVSKYAVQIARAMNMNKDEITVIKNAGLLHDIGKIGVDKEILIKKGPLTKAEYEILKQHPVIGINILKDVKFLEKEIPIILYHHERCDGSGYPHGLKEREIPFSALILAVADAFVAMRTDRKFKSKLSEDEAIEEMKRGRGTQFSPEIVDTFIKLLKNKN